MNREERRQLAMRMRRGIATPQEVEAFTKKRGDRGRGGWGGGSGYYIMPDGAVSPVPKEGARILRRHARRALVGIERWRTGTRAPSTVEVPKEGFGVLLERLARHRR